MIGQTNIIGPRAYTKEWFKYGSHNRTDTFETIPGHYYLLGVSVLSGASETSQPHTAGLEIIKRTANNTRTGSSSGISADGWLFIVKATSTTARMNCRIATESIDAHPDHNCVHWIDIGTSLPTGIEENIHQAAQTWTLSSLIKGHYYAVFVNALHNNSEYFTVFLRHHNCKDILHTDCMESNGSSSLVSHGILGIIKAEYTNAYYILRNSTSNAPAYNCLTWLDLGANFIHEY